MKMRQVIHILMKEFRSYFVTPIAYIVISIFLIVIGWFFFSAFFLYGQASLRSFFGLLPIIFSFIIPAITMRLFSEELNVGSYETLLTLPVTYKEVILGKFFASVLFVIAMLIPTLAYPITISFLGQLDWGPVFGGFFGAILLGASYSAVGIFASSVTRNQIIAFIVGMVICFSFTLFDKIIFLVPVMLDNIIEFIGADYHFQNISKGVIDTRDIIYFLSLIFVGLYATHLALESKN